MENLYILANNSKSEKSDKEYKAYILQYKKYFKGKMENFQRVKRKANNNLFTVLMMTNVNGMRQGTNSSCS